MAKPLESLRLLIFKIQSELRFGHSFNNYSTISFSLLTYIETITGMLKPLANLTAPILLLNFICFSELPCNIGQFKKCKRGIYDSEAIDGIK